MTITARKLPVGILFSLIALVGIMTLVRSQAQSDALYLAFVSNQTGADDIFIMRDDGGNQINLTESRFRDWNPSWSPDGTQIAFNSDRDGNAEIYIMKNNGENLTNLTNHEADDFSPAWSPNGTEIAFVSTRNGSADLFILQIASGAVEQLTTDGAPKGHPSWSPDSSQIVYWQAVPNGSQIRTISRMGGEPVILVAEGTNDWPTWSPDGSRIAFHRIADGSATILSVSPAGNMPMNLLSDRDPLLRPAWSPDGSRIAYVSNRDGNVEIYTEPATGGFPQRLTTNPADDTSPVWQPRPAPINLEGGIAQQQQFTIVNPASADDSEIAGEGQARLLAPDVVSENELIVVRLEVEATELTETDVVLPTSTPSLSNQPTPTALPLRDRQYANVYTIMGAELRGVDLTNFAIDPAPTDYVLRLDPNTVNYWEWYLRPTGNDVFRTNFLSVVLYIPERQVDGDIAKTVVNRFNFDITVERIQNPDPTPEAESFAGAVESPLFAISVDESSLIIVANSDDNLAPMTLAGAGDDYPFVIQESFAGVSDIAWQPGICLVYEVTPDTVLPRRCQQIFKVQLNPIDIFWFDPTRNRQRTIIVRYRNGVTTCPNGMSICEIRPTMLQSNIQD